MWAARHAGDQLKQYSAQLAGAFQARPGSPLELSGNQVLLELSGNQVLLELSGNQVLLEHGQPART